MPVVSPELVLERGKYALKSRTTVADIEKFPFRSRATVRTCALHLRWGLGDTGEDKLKSDTEVGGD